MVAPPIATMTEEEYLAFERASEEKHEYLDGRVYAMAGASEPHSAIIASTLFRLYGQLIGRPCRVYPNDMRIKNSVTGLQAYPDLVIVCGERRFVDGRRDVILNPTVLIEVLSPSTENVDRGMKWFHYQHLESLQEYLLIAQDSPRIEHYIRQEDGGWYFSAAIGLESVIELPSINCRLALAEVYENVSFGG